MQGVIYLVQLILFSHLPVHGASPTPSSLFRLLSLSLLYQCHIPLYMHCKFSMQRNEQDGAYVYVSIHLSMWPATFCCRRAREKQLCACTNGTTGIEAQLGSILVTNAVVINPISSPD
uniref:Secreted protein n=1 Tax=Oryza brachyantha TaxID=4533 RepID=J3LY89_ORYBR